MMSEEQFLDLKKQNNIMIKLLAAIAIEGKNLNEQVNLLTTVGLVPLQIAEILGKNANLIRVTKSSLKKKDGKK
jgi:DNA-binding CsgD family transcriptional regulator